MNSRTRTALIEFVSFALITFILYSYFDGFDTMVWLVPVIGAYRIYRTLSGKRTEKEAREEVSLFPYQVLYMLFMIGVFYLVMGYFSG